MSYFIKQNQTTQPLTFLLIDSNDHMTGKTGVMPIVTISKNGAQFIAPSGAVTEIANGWYKVAGNATDSNTLGNLILHATAAGSDPVDENYLVVAFDPLATSLGLLLAKTTNITGFTDLAPGSAMTLTSAYDQAKTAAQSDSAVSNSVWTTTLATRLYELDTSAVVLSASQPNYSPIKAGSPITLDPGSTVNINLDQPLPISNITNKTTQTVGDALSVARADGAGKWVISSGLLTLYGPDGSIITQFLLNDPVNPTTRTPNV